MHAEARRRGVLGEDEEVVVEAPVERDDDAERIRELVAAEEGRGGADGDVLHVREQLAAEVGDRHLDGVAVHGLVRTAAAHAEDALGRLDACLARADHAEGARQQLAGLLAMRDLFASACHGSIIPLQGRRKAMVGAVGLEPTILAASVFKTDAYANSATPPRACFNLSPLRRAARRPASRRPATSPRSRRHRTRSTGRRAGRSRSPARHRNPSTRGSPPPRPSRPG